MQPAIRVLFTEDVASDAELEVRELKRAGLRIEHRIADTEESFVAALREFEPDLILSDFSMPSFDGMSALALARELSPDTPFVFVSGTIGEEYAIRALKNGATDYVLKTNLVRLPAAVERALAEAKARRERRRTEAELEIARGRLASIFEALPDMLWSVDVRTDRIAYVSPASKALFGRPPEDFLADEQLWLQVVHPEDRPRVKAAWDAMGEKGAFDIEYRALHPDGMVRWINDRGRRVEEGGDIGRIDGVARDITEQVAHRQRIARLSRIRDLGSAVNSALVRFRERGELLAEVCRIAVGHGGFLGANVALLDRDTLDARWVASAGVILEGLETSARPEDASSRDITGRVLLTAQPAVWNDLIADRDVRARDEMLAYGIRSAAALPLVVDGKAHGSLCLYSGEPNYFDQEEMGMFAELAANVSFALESIAKQERIAYLAHYDALTGLPNRALFYDKLRRAIEEAGDGAHLGLAMFDLERFKAINDTYGKEVGDHVLQAVGERLRSTAGDVARVARLGSNLFAVIFPAKPAAADGARSFERAAQRFFAAPFNVDGREVSLSAKAGVAIYPVDGDDADKLFRNAEASLKRAKETGEACVVYDPRINARVAEQVELEARLRKAVERGELFLHFQPKVDLVTRRLLGVEALMRWSSEGVMVSPAKFVPVLERTGLILEAGRQAIATASRTYAAWRARGLPAPRIAVNVSAIQLARRSFVADVRAALAQSGGDGGGVDLEVTESLLMTEIEESIRKLREVREMGLRISLDDFGTGYSSLAYLGKLPVDTLKIDRGFVHGMTDNPDHTSIISTIISLAQALRMKVVAEGVETEQQAQLLKLLRCDEGQGYLFSPPLAAERLEAVLAPPT